MAYLLLLALVMVAGIVFIQLSRAASLRSVSQNFFGIGFIFLGFGLLAEIILGFTLDEYAAKLFYLARGTLALAWLGQGLLLFLFPGRPILRWLNYALVIGSLGMFVLILVSQVTTAQDWYSPASPIYGQIGDLLATNRPTRWGTFGLNLFGSAILIAGPLYFLFIQSVHRTAVKIVAAVLIAFSAIGLFFPLYWPPAKADPFFYLIELLAPVALFVGLNNLPAADIRSDARRKPR
ncbi:MAG: hypothetical protein M1347_07950 [Chloroflexi bacterium]|nr:hypothetical protein [Chloroflexota bacterium]